MTKLRIEIYVCRLAMGMKRSWAGAARVCSFVAASTLLVTPLASQAYAAVGTWATAPMREQADADLAGKTLRQIVRTSIAGNHLHIRISNLFGDHPLRVEDVRIAVRREGCSIETGSDHAVQFAGQSTAVVAPGSTAYSDAIPMAAASLEDLAVSFYLPSQIGPATYHQAAHQTSCMASGDKSSQVNLPNSRPIGSIYFLTNVDVDASMSPGAIVVLGASITEGYAATENASSRWPDVLAQRLARAGINVGILNEGISGNRLLANGAGPNAEQRFQRDVLDQPGVRWIIFSDDPINDLGSTRPAPAAATLIAATNRLIDRAHGRNIRFLCSTLTPYKGANYWRPKDEIARQRFNSFVRSSRGCDGVIDQDAATHDPEDPMRFLPGYDSGDHLHPNDAGHKAIGNAINLSFFSDRRAFSPASTESR